MTQLLVLEGPDGVGKSTLSKALATSLRTAGQDAVCLSFPGHEPGSLGRHIYDLHHNPTLHGVTTLTPAGLQALHIAAHIDAIQNTIVPLLTAGTTVVLDRFWWSTWAYGRVAGVSDELLSAMLSVEHIAWGSVRPHAVVLVHRHLDSASSPHKHHALAAAYDALATTEAQHTFVVRISNDGAIDEVLNKLMRSLFPDRSDLTRSMTSSAATHEQTKAPPAAETLTRAPTLFSRLDPAVPSKAYDTYWRFAERRQEAFFKRFCGASPPYSDDAILARHKFTNAYRASDRVSQFLIRSVIYEGDQSPDEVFFRTILFKLFNKIGTWTTLTESLGTVSWSDFSFERYDDLLSQSMNRGSRIYSAAYIMPAALAFGSGRKHSTHLRLLEKMMADELPKRLQDARTMSAAFELIRSYPMMGDFLAFQFLIDLNYGPLLTFSEMDFVVPGPGARDGIRKCFTSLGGLRESDIIRLVAERQEAEFERLGIRFKSLWGRPLQLIDCQNLFCEVDKYCRVAHPDIQGLSGRTRIKQKYTPTAGSISYWYPPKWGLNETIEKARDRSALTSPAASPQQLALLTGPQSRQAHRRRTRS